jgi:predicted RNA-binding Zn-ribbon protein involved in translation (DUF1610 family)
VVEEVLNQKRFAVDGRRHVKCAVGNNYLAISPEAGDVRLKELGMGIALSASGDYHPHNPFFLCGAIKTKNGEKQMGQKIINCPHCGKMISHDVLAKEKTVKPKCPQCGSGKSFKNGFRRTHSGIVQTFLCRHCGYRFS